MSLVSSSPVDLHLTGQTKKPRFAIAEIIGGLVIVMVVLGLGAVAVLSSPTTLP